MIQMLLIDPESLGNRLAKRFFRSGVRPLFKFYIG